MREEVGAILSNYPGSMSGYRHTAVRLKRFESPTQTEASHALSNPILQSLRT